MWYTYQGGHFWGMHFIWWIIWIFFIIWIFATPWYIPGQRAKKETPLDILRKRFANGEITKEEHDDMKKHIERN